MIQFYKYQGTGNDFVLLDNRTGEYNWLQQKNIQLLCDRHVGIGADGLMLLSNSEVADFHMTYFNSDGNQSTMCGNGGRCMIRFANDLGIKKSGYSFTAIDGLHLAAIDTSGEIRIKLNASLPPKVYEQDQIIHTGSPHYVKRVDDVSNIDVKLKGAEIRKSDAFKDEGINVNFVQVIHENELFVRTYERGVEDETLSCGTGVTAAALSFKKFEPGHHQILINTPGGRLKVDFIQLNNGGFDEVWLSGPAEFVFQGEINIR
jgi:diaminopimelate epimerase